MVGKWWDSDEPISERLLEFARAWRRGDVVNLGPGLTRFCTEIKKLEAERDELRERLEQCAKFPGPTYPTGE